MKRDLASRVLSVGLVTLSLASCGGSTTAPSGTSGSAGGGGSSGTTVTISPSGVNPAQLTVPQGTRVLFTNGDTRTHEMTSDPHPEHDACVEINAVGFISPNQTKETGNLNTVRTCGFHDHNDPNNTKLWGRIVIQ